MHGRLDAASRDAVMRKFKLGELDVLVATTVIEVGVDVPAATVMVVHDAERFGLAQLHQLRGRVGRGGGKSHCVLVSAGSPGEDGERRLGAMVATHDGFRIAEEDLALRGFGELLGPRQAGVPRLRFGDLTQHTELLLEARRHADASPRRGSGAGPTGARGALKAALARRLAQSVYGAGGRMIAALSCLIALFTMLMMMRAGEHRRTFCVPPVAGVDRRSNTDAVSQVR